jgi:DNA-binding CsgD family transcriptional regulator
VTLWGRRQQCEVLDGLLAEVRAGRSRALVVRGAPGIGKTALLGYAAETAQDFQVARAEGIESEMELPFAALHQLCGRMLGRLDRLPGPQRDALGVAFGLWSGSAPERFLVGLAVLGLLSEVAADRPLLCLVDDAQWLDRASAQALAFAARRLDAESVAMLFGTRNPAGEGDLADLPALVLEGLPDEDARALLASVIPGRLDERVRDRIIAESGGNPLALLELPRGVTTAELAGGFGIMGAEPLSGRIEDSFQRRIAPLPGATRRLLLLAAAEPTGDPALLWRAAGLLGIGAEAAAPAEAQELVDFGAQVTFRHPLIRSAIYRPASPGERREVHRALAGATDPQLDPDRRVWHLAQAAPGPDEDVASELERSADRAQARGGLPAAAAFMERSAALTLDPVRRAERTLAAAQVTAQAGAFDAALRLLVTAKAGPLTELQYARADLLRGQVAFASSRISDASLLLLQAAKRLEPLDARLARETYLEALAAAVYAARFVTGGGLREAAEAARAAPAASQPPTAPDLLLDGLALLITEGYSAATSTLKRALGAFSSEDISREEALRWLWLACPTAVRLWDDESWDELSGRQVQLARDAGALGVLPIALNQHAGLHLQQGDFIAATSLIEEVTAITQATGSQLPLQVPLALAAFRGRERQASGLIETSTKDLARRGEGVGPTLLQWATAVLGNGLGRYQDALAAAQRAVEDQYELVFSTWAAVELIEAATRSGVPGHAAAALERLSDSARASGTDWALGTEACARALLSGGQTAERLYREALVRLGRTRLRVPLARAHLLYGEWLRRENRRIDAREQLRTAQEMFTTMGAEGFAERATRELRATGERVRKRSTYPPSQLTAREAQIARLASDGLSNPEIAARLFMSPRTVEYHLHKVFTKLAISSRSQLHAALANRGLDRFGVPYRGRYEEVFGEPIRGRLTGLVPALALAPRIDGVVAAFDFEQALRLPGPGEGGTDQVRRADRVVFRQDHEQRPRRDQLDRPRRCVFEDRLERAHGDLIAPGSPSRLRLMREIVGILVGLQRETLAGQRDVRDVLLAALGRVPDTLLNGHLLERRELFRAQSPAGDQVEVHRAHLAHYRLDPRVVRSDVQDSTAAEARAPDTEPVSVDLRLQRQPRQRAAIVLGLVAGKDSLAWLAAASTERAIVEHQHRKARLSEPAGNRLKEHLFHCSDAVCHRHGGHGGP